MISQTSRHILALCFPMIRHQFVTRRAPACPRLYINHIQLQPYSNEDIENDSIRVVNRPSELRSESFGPLHVNHRCEVCHNVYGQCPGHSGHIELDDEGTEVFFFRVHSVSYLCSILNSFCFYCLRPRLPDLHRVKPDLKSWTLPPSKRSTNFYNTDEITTWWSMLGQKGIAVKTCEFCSRHHIKWYMDKKEKMFVYPMFFKAEENPPQIRLSDLYYTLAALPLATLDYLCVTYQNHPKDMLWRVLPVCSHIVRPSPELMGFKNDKDNDNDVSKGLRFMLTSKGKVKETWAESTQELLLNTLQPGKTMGGMEAAWLDMQRVIDEQHSQIHQNRGASTCSTGQKLQTIPKRNMGQKYGRERGTIAGKCFRNCCRMVFGVSVHIRPNEVEVPIFILKKLSRHIPVQFYNMRECTQWVLNGPLRYPGANYVTLKDGRVIDLKLVNTASINMNEVSIVHRHLIRGDYVLVNRQPTLHAQSIMAYKVVPSPTEAGRVLRLHFAVFKGLGLDLDGDEGNLYVLDTYEAVVEAAELMAVEHHMLSEKMWCEWILHAVIGAYLLTDRTNCFYTREEALHLLGDLDRELPEPAIWCKGTMLWTGYQLVSVILPLQLNILDNHLVMEDETSLLIVRGEMLAGRLTNGSLNGKRGILYRTILDISDRQAAIELLYEGYLLFVRSSELHGTSVGLLDTMVDPDDLWTVEQRRELPDHHESESEPSDRVDLAERVCRAQDTFHVVQRYADQHFATHTPDREADADVEQHLIELGSRIVKQTTFAVQKYMKYVHEHESSNGLIWSIESEAKMSWMTLNSLTGLIGQAFYDGRRYGEEDPFFRKGFRTLEMFGFPATSNFSTGVSLSAMVTDKMAAGKSVSDKNNSTATAGYTSRKLNVNATSVSVDYLGRSVDLESGLILMDHPGKDGYLSHRLVSCRINAVTWRELEVLRRYHVLGDMNLILPYCSQGTQAMYLQLAEPWPADRSFLWQSHFTEHTWQRWQAVKLEFEERWLKWIRQMIQLRVDLKRAYIACNTSESDKVISLPTSFKQVLLRCEHELGTSAQTRLHFGEYLDFFETLLDIMESLRLVSSGKVRLLFYEQMSPILLAQRHLETRHLQWVALETVRVFREAACTPGDPVALMYSQRNSEPYTQMLLKSTSKGGDSSGASVFANVVNGKFIERMRLVLRKDCTEDDAYRVGAKLKGVRLRELTTAHPVWTRVSTEEDDDDEQHITSEVVDVTFTLTGTEDSHTALASFFETRWYFTLIETLPLQTSVTYRYRLRVGDQPFVSAMVTKSQSLESGMNAMLIKMLDDVVFGSQTVTQFEIVTQEIHTGAGVMKRWCVMTEGSDVKAALALPEVDPSRFMTYDIHAMCEWGGLVMARRCLYHIFRDIFMSMSNDCRNLWYLANMMTMRGAVLSFKINGIGRYLPPLQRALFEQVMKNLNIGVYNTKVDRLQSHMGASLSNQGLRGVGTAVGPGSHFTILPKHQSALTRTLLETHRERQLRLGTMSNYVFSLKADGLRVLILFIQHEVIVIDRSNTMYHVGTVQASEPLYNAPFWSGTLIDTEWCQVTTTTDDVTHATTLIMAFDLLMLSGHVVRTTYDHRMTLLTTFVDLWATHATQQRTWKVHHEHGFVRPPRQPNTAISMSPFPENVFWLVKPVFALTHLHEAEAWCRYYQDQGLPCDNGLIFTDLKQPPTPFRHSRTGVLKLKLEETDRELSEHTIDFRLKKILDAKTSSDLKALTPPEQLTRNSSAFQKLPTINDEVTFPIRVWGLYVNTTLFGYTSSCTSHTQPNEFPPYHDTVVECAWHKRLQCWYPLHVRNKMENSKETVIHTLKHIQEGLTWNHLQHIIRTNSSI